jgi:CDP-diacylglycerol---glycerol-3-phosphate 3-phosphatidyltransferase
LFYTPGRHIESGALFALASFTDWLDGFLARRWNISTVFGAFLDPVADKLMVSTALALLSGRHGAIVALPAALILARELAVSALREWMAQTGQRDAVQVGFQGKVKTAFTMLSLTLMLLVPEIGTNSGRLTDLFLPSLAALYLSALITVTSGIVYFRAAEPFLMQK